MCPLQSYVTNESTVSEMLIRQLLGQTTGHIPGTCFTVHALINHRSVLLSLDEKTQNHRKPFSLKNALNLPHFKVTREVINYNIHLESPTVLDKDLNTALTKRNNNDSLI